MSRVARRHAVWGRFVLALLLAAFATAAAAQVHKPRRIAEYLDRPETLRAVRASGLPQPLVVLIEQDPWAMVIGSDSPSFALYGDGRVIYRTADGYRTALLGPEAAETLLQPLQLPELRSAAGYYDATTATDQPTTTLLVYAEEPPFSISIYGSLQHREALSAEVRERLGPDVAARFEHDLDVRGKLPGAVLAAIDRLQAFAEPSAVRWVPERLEVMIWPYEYAPDASVAWPVGWPDLESPDTVRRGSDSYSLLIPASQADRLRSLLASRKPKGAVELAGRKWAVGVRLPFPHEALWMGPAQT